MFPLIPPRIVPRLAPFAGNRRGWLGGFLVTAILAIAPASAQLVISEFLANNLGGLRDEINEHEDWIEITNPTTATVAVGDWYLTDDAGCLRKWPLPAWTLGAGKRMVVFASDRDRRPPQAVAGQDNAGTAAQPRLATNFKISSNAGKYLALSKENRGPGKEGVVDVISSFTYPKQVPDVSYGLQDASAGVALVAANAPLKALVPTVANGGNALGAAWRGGAEPFNDTAWTTGAQGAGVAGIATPVGATNLKLRLNATSAADLTTDTSGAGHHATNPGNTTIHMPAATDTAANPLLRRGAMQFAAASSSQLVVPAHADFNAASGSIIFWLKSAGMSGGGAEAAMLFRRRSTAGTVLALTDAANAYPGRLYCQPTGGGTAFYSTTRVDDDQWHHVAFTYDQAAGGTDRFYIDGVESGAATHASAWSWPTADDLLIGRSDSTYWYKYNGLLDEFRFYNTALPAVEILRIYRGADEDVAAADVGLDLAGVLPGHGGTLLRIPFSVSNPAAVRTLRFAARCNDGFIAYLNGSQIATFNAPTTPAWDSIATATALATRTQTCSIPTVNLTSGRNILAIQALNNTTSDPNFLVLCTLDGVVADATGYYLASNTPGAVNSANRASLGPFVTDVRYNGALELPPRPAGGGGSPQLVISAKVTPSLWPLAALNPVQLAYRVMFGAETILPMTAGPGGVYTAALATSGVAAGQLLRWRIIATDNTAVQGTAPAYPDPSNSDQYFGTVALDGITSQLPIYHIFVPGTYQFNNSHVIDQDNVGGRGDLFYDGELYDNIFIRIKGDTTRTMQKRAHRVDFNADHQFRYAPDRKRLRELALNAEYVDPSYSRQFMSMWLHRATGTGAPGHFPVRCQINGGFWQLAFHTDTQDFELLDNMGLDPNGAMYASVGQMDCARGEKQTRVTEDTSDMANFVTAITAADLTTRTRNVFDQVDLPAVINYLAVARLTHEGDDVWANMVIHRDSDNTGEWRIIPFDTNLSWGQLFYADYPADNANLQATNDRAKSHPLYGNRLCYPLDYASGTYNRFYDAIISVPATRAMLLRRMRSIMDQYLQAPGTPSPLLEQLFDAHAARIAPEAALDRAQWGWPPFGGVYGLGNDSLATAISQLKSQFLAPRRTHFFNTHTSTVNVGIANANSAGIPIAPQPAHVAIRIAGYDYHPAGSTTQDEEYVKLANPNGFAVDLSGWTLGGGVDFTFKGGTVITAGGSLYVSPRQRAFRTRTVSPKGGEGNFVVGPYQGQLSSRGELVTLSDATGTLVTSVTTPASPTPAQLALRITELNYHPSDPTPAELAAISSVVASDFEYVELLNTGTTPLALAGARFTKGIEFTFPAGTTLAPGARLLVVANLPAFQLRYGTTAPTAGPFLGSLDNGGEELELVDPSGEVLLDFVWDDAWFPATDGSGRTLVVRDSVPSHTGYELATHWAVSGSATGSPGTSDADFASTFTGWRWDHFTPAEVTLPGGTENTALAGPGANPDGDRFDNFGEYAFGLDPRRQDGAAVLSISRTTSGPDTIDTVAFNRRHLALDLRYGVEFSTDLATWTANAVQTGPVTALDNGMERVTFRDTAPAGANRRFARVVAVKIP
jgi:hypothetical protein